MALLSSAVRSDAAALNDGRPARSASWPWRALGVVELAVCVVAVWRDWLLPTFVILGVAAVSLLVRREPVSSLGFRRVEHAWRMVGSVLALTLAWTALQLVLLMPVVEHATGEKQDVSDFAGLQGDLGRLLLLLALSWTVAAVGEEAAYRGFVLTRGVDVAGAGTAAVVLAVLATSLLFGLAHTEQGAVGVALATIDALFFAALRLHFRTLWAAVLAHGLSNTFGLVAFYLVGPITGLW